MIAYLIHANHWTLSRAYAFVTERRKGISPNIGFVSELMTFEEQELGGKSVGVVNPSSAIGGGIESGAGGSMNGNGIHYGGMNQMMKTSTFGARRNANLRESLPPLASSSQNSDMMMLMMPGQLSAGGPLGGSGCDANGGGGGGVGGSGRTLMMTPTIAARVGDAGQEVEIKDASGRYRHARRAPVDENTLQPMRRVSKAGLESATYSFSDV